MGGRNTTVLQTADRRPYGVTPAKVIGFSGERVTIRLAASLGQGQLGISVNLTRVAETEVPVIELGTRPTVIMYAAPFCFGPVSTSLSIAAELRRFDVAIVWLAYGTSLELLRAGSYVDYIVPFDLGDADDRRHYAHLIEEASAVVVNTDPEFARFSISLNPNTIYVDILYWMWHEIPDVVNRCELYVFEDFARTEDQIERVGLPKNARRIGPLINLRPPDEVRKPAKDHLLVSLGGLHRPGDGSRALLDRYQETVYRAVLDSVSYSDEFPVVYFAGGGIGAKTITLNNGVEVRCGCLSKEKHQELLERAKAVVISPGLTGFYEVATARVPVFFLPPHNYSQHLQLETFRSVLGPEYYSDWERLGVEEKIPCFLPEDEILSSVDAILDRIVSVGDRLTCDLQKFFSGAYREYETEAAIRLVESVTGASSAPAQVAEMILDRVGPAQEAKRTDLQRVPLPRKVTLELFEGCQLRCPLCPTGSRKRPGRFNGALSVHLARQVLDELGEHLEIVDFFNWGEPFLNPDACRIIRMFSERGIRTVVSSNLQRIPDPQEIVDSGLSELIVSCHGMTQATYEKYMVGGVLQKTLDNLDRILVATGPNPAMKIVLRFVVFAHNEHELILAQARYESSPVKVEASPMRIEMRDEILATPTQNLTVYGKWVPESSRYYDKDRLEARRAPIGCNLTFEETSIGVDGSVYPCCSCYDPDHRYGNLHDAGFEAVWNGSAYAEARRVVSKLGETGQENVVCRTCKNSGYRDF